MPNLVLANQLIETLPYGISGLFNPWRDHCPFETPENGPEDRIIRLALHLDCNPRAILVGEAIGYQGGRYSGIAFTSERLLRTGRIPRIARGLAPAVNPETTVLRAFCHHRLEEAL